MIGTLALAGPLITREISILLAMGMAPISAEIIKESFISREPSSNSQMIQRHMGDMKVSIAQAAQLRRYIESLAIT